MRIRVWGLTTSSYSSYEVMALFTTPELADQALALNKVDDPYELVKVEEFDLFDAMPPVETVYWMIDYIEGVHENSRTALPWNHWQFSAEAEGTPTVGLWAGRMCVSGTDRRRVVEAFDASRTGEVIEEEI